MAFNNIKSKKINILNEDETNGIVHRVFIYKKIQKNKN